MYSLSDIVTSANETKVINPHQFYDDVFERRVFNGTFIIQTFYSGHYHFMNEKGLKALKESGLINDGETWSHARNRLTRWLIRPNKRIMNLVSPYRKKPGTIQLGVQIRTGGKLANTHEPTVFLNDSSMPFIISTINSQLINRPSITELYISSDSTIMIERIVKEYRKWNVHYMNCTIRGHVTWTPGSMECALMDMILISESDYLIYTGGSTFGFLISNLMGFITAPIIPSYWKWNLGL